MSKVKIFTHTMSAYISKYKLNRKNKKKFFVYRLMNFLFREME